MSTKYTKEILLAAAKDSISVMEVLDRLGLKRAGGNHSHISRMLVAHEIDTRHFLGRSYNRGKPPRIKKSATEILVVLPEGSGRPRANQLRRAMIESGLDYSCTICYTSGEWQGKPMTLEVDHRNGDWLDNRIDNLRFLCPNCHSQQETNRKRKPV